MASQIIRLQETSPKEAVEAAIFALRRGKLVVFPTETVYGLGALASREDAITRLISAKGRKAGHALPIAIAGSSVLRSYAPSVDPISERLARRCWPGPVTLVIDTRDAESRIQSLSETVRTAIIPCGAAGFRVPDHPLFLEILRRLDEPVVLTSANLTGEPPATNAEEAKVGLGDRPDLILDDGPAKLGHPSTVIAVTGNRINVIREGALPKEKIKQMTAKIILFVCTGNTCRSPMAEIVCSRLLAERLHCDIGDLEANGYVVLSAGVATFPGSGASSGAKEVILSRGLSLESHRSQPVTEELLRFADRIYVMSAAHRDSLARDWPEHCPRIELLRPDGKDVADPLGGDYNVYQNCTRQIEAAIAARMNDIL